MFDAEISTSRPIYIKCVGEPRNKYIKVQIYNINIFCFFIFDIIDLYLYEFITWFTHTLNTDILYSNKCLDVEISASYMPLHNCMK